MIGAEGEESNLSRGTLSLLDQLRLVSPVLHIRGSVIRPNLHSAAAVTTHASMWIIVCTSIARMTCPSMKARAVGTHAAT